MKKAVIIFLSFFGLFAFANLAQAALSCSVTSGSCGGTTIFKMQSTSNSHVSLYSQTGYGYYVCCSGVTGLGNSCSGSFATVLKSSSATNAHVEKNNYPNYANNICISGPSGSTVACTYGASCSGDYVCLGSISGDTNAHVGDCNAYSTKICCEAIVGCTPNCAGKNCGSDGCVGSCGTCGTNSCTAAHTTGSCSQSCSGGLCQACTPSCSCVAGWYECNGNMADGCESPTPCAGTFDFSISTNPISGSVTQGGSVLATVGTILTSGTTQAVSFTASGLPTGASASFAPINCNPSCNSAMTINALATTPVGAYSINVCGTGGSQNHCVTYGLTISASGAGINPPSATTNPAGNITGNSATLNGTLNNMGGAASCLVWFEWGTSPGVYSVSSTPVVANTPGAFSKDISGLNSGVTYYFKIRAKNGGSW
jgi:hypothetical protein